MERDSTGRYRALLPGFSAEIERAGLQLSPYGSEDGDCSIVGRGTSGSHARVDVACFARSGEPQDRRWVLSLATDQPIPF